MRGGFFVQWGHFLDKEEVVLQMRMSELLNYKLLRRVEVQWFLRVSFSIIKNVLHQSLGYYF